MTLEEWEGQQGTQSDLHHDDHALLMYSSHANLRLCPNAPHASRTVYSCANGFVCS